MVKVLIYSSKEIYDNASYKGRAEADIIAYRDNHLYVITKNRTNRCTNLSKVAHFSMETIIQLVEHDEWNRDMESHGLQLKYKNHPYTELMKNS
jgi:hypothetical protein